MPEAVHWSDVALSLAEPLRLDETIDMAMVTKGTAMATRGQIREGLALLEGAVVDATAHGQHLAALRGLNNLASFTVEIDPRASLERTKQGMATVRRLGMLAFDGYHAGNAAGAAEQLGEWAWLDEALDWMLEEPREPALNDWLLSVRDQLRAWTGGPDIALGERLLAEARREADYQSERNVGSWLARCAFAAGDPARALELDEPFFNAAPGEAYDFGMAGRFALHAGRVDAARRVLEATGRGRGGVSDHMIEELRAGIAAVDGRRDEAVQLYRAALAGFRAFGTRFNLALTVLDMATLLGPDDPAVTAVVEEGRAILTELGARLLLDRLDEALAPRGTGWRATGASRPKSAPSLRVG
jgi:hypothetical protein